MRLPAARDAWHATRRDRGVPRCRLFYETQLGAETAKPLWPNAAPCQMRKATPSRLSRRTCRDPKRFSKSLVRTRELRGPRAATAALRWSRSPPYVSELLVVSMFATYVSMFLAVPVRLQIFPTS